MPARARRKQRLFWRPLTQVGVLQAPRPNQLELGTARVSRWIKRVTCSMWQTSVLGRKELQLTWKHILGSKELQLTFPLGKTGTAGGDNCR